MQNVQTAPKLCLGLPEGVLLYIEGRSLDIAKRKLQSEKPKGFSTLEEKQKVCTICFFNSISFLRSALFLHLNQQIHLRNVCTPPQDPLPQ